MGAVWSSLSQAAASLAGELETHPLDLRAGSARRERNSCGCCSYLSKERGHNDGLASAEEAAKCERAHATHAGAGQQATFVFLAWEWKMRAVGGASFAPTAGNSRGPAQANQSDELSSASDRSANLCHPTGPSNRVVNLTGRRASKLDGEEDKRTQAAAEDNKLTGVRQVGRLVASSAGQQRQRHAADQSSSSSNGGDAPIGQVGQVGQVGQGWHESAQDSGRSSLPADRTHTWPRPPGLPAKTITNNRELTLNQRERADAAAAAAVGRPRAALQPVEGANSTCRSPDASGGGGGGGPFSSRRGSSKPNNSSSSFDNSRRSSAHHSAPLSRLDANLQLKHEQLLLDHKTRLLEPNFGAKHKPGISQQASTTGSHPKPLTQQAAAADQVSSSRSGMTILDSNRALQRLSSDQQVANGNPKQRRPLVFYNQRQKKSKRADERSLSADLVGDRVPAFALNSLIQDASYFESTQARWQDYEFDSSGKPPPRPWLQPNQRLTKCASLDGPADSRRHSSQAVARHRSIGELVLTATDQQQEQHHQSPLIAHLKGQIGQQPEMVAGSGANEFTVLSYNVLSDRLVRSERFPNSPHMALNWLYRRELILRQLEEYEADLVALQELEMEQFSGFFEPKLASSPGNYAGLFESKSRARTMDAEMRKRVDGCAIFYKRSRFRLVARHLVEFNRVAFANAQGSEDMVNRVATRDNIAMVAVLEPLFNDDGRSAPDVADELKTSGDSPQPEARLESDDHRPAPTRIVVCNTHIHWDPEFCDVKLVQTIMLMNELKHIAANYSPDPLHEVPLVLLGDFNSLPRSGVTSYLLDGHISSHHKEFKSFKYSACANLISQNCFKLTKEQPLQRGHVQLTATISQPEATSLSHHHQLEHRRRSSPGRKLVPAVHRTLFPPPVAPYGKSSSSSSFDSYHPQNQQRQWNCTPIEYEHPFKLKSAYELGTMPFTNYTTQFKETIDYIFYSHNSLSLLGLLGPLDKRWLKGNKIRGFPQLHFPSDHLPLLVKLRLLSSASERRSHEQFEVASAKKGAHSSTTTTTGKQPKQVEPLAPITKNIKKSNKKQKHAPRRDSTNETVGFNHRRPKQVQARGCLACPAPIAATALTTATLSTLHI